MHERAALLASYIKSLSDFTMVAPESVDGNYDHMGATITDAILQAGISYQTVVEPRVQDLREKHPEARTTSSFRRLLEQQSPETLLRFSGKKPQLVLEVARFFESQGIQTESDLRTWLQEPSHIDRLKQLKGIGNKTVDYFGILVGIQGVAIDVHLSRFLQEAGLGQCTYNEARQIVSLAADVLDIPRAVLDHSIWLYMSNRRKGGKSQQ
jgi:endonuclease III